MSAKCPTFTPRHPTPQLSNMMKRTLTTVLMALALTGAAQAEVTGTYSGILQAAPGVSLPIVMHIAPGSATMDSPSQHAYGIAMSVDYQQGDSIALSVRQIGMAFGGCASGRDLRGTFTQGMLRVPLALTLSDEPAPAAAAPAAATPAAPKPYTEREVALDAAPGVHLEGTLTLPGSYVAGTTPVALLITGSGQQNRDEEIFGHRPFAVIADSLARRGIATLRYDDRGVGGSTGPVLEATTADFTADAQAWIDYLRRQGFATVGAIGHSEGGRIAFGLSGADFIVGLGAPALRGDSILIAQNELILTASGVDPELAALYGKALEQLYRDVATPGTVPPDPQAYAASLTRDWPATPRARALEANLAKLPQALASSPWLMHFIQDSPAADIAAFPGRVLVIYGERDCQVPPAPNAEAMRRLNPGADIRVMPGLNHLLQPCVTGLPQEYATISVAISPEVLEAIAAFIGR